jgi:PAS domain S-box-containing protein
VENQKMAERFKQLALRIEEQRQLLDSINGTLTEYIGLKDNSGQYRYVNPAFAEAVGRTQDELIGLDDTAIFGFDTAKRLEKSDRRVIESRSHDTVHQEIYLQSKRHDLQISKMPFIDPDGNLSGIVATFRDVTELLENQRRSERATRQTIEVLARAIELNDPYLAGHSRLMSALAVETAKNLGCTEEISKTVETASFLSQIGKMFVDQELLQKPGILTDEEKAEVEKHVEYSANILREIEFDLPIFDSIIQMNEFLDGSGYPAGLKGDEISLPARILAATNSFCAMVKPRSYRPAKSLEDVLSILDSVPDKYDPEIIQALRSATDSVNGKKILIELV